MTATFEEEVNRYHVELFRFAFCLTGNELVAEELTRRAFWNVRFDSSNSRVRLFSEVLSNSNAFTNDFNSGPARLSKKRAIAYPIMTVLVNSIRCHPNM